MAFGMHVHVRHTKRCLTQTVSKRTPSIIGNIDTILYMYVAVLLVFDRISYRPGGGRMRPNVVSTKLKRRSLDKIENSLMLLAVSLL